MTDEQAEEPKSSVEEDPTDVGVCPTCGEKLTLDYICEVVDCPENPDFVDPSIDEDDLPDDDEE